MKRRTFLLAGLGAGGALFLGWSLLPPRQRLHPSAAINGPEGAIALNGWLMVSPNDTITVVTPKAEMGQGIQTALAMLVVEELDGDWSKVQVVHAPVDRVYNNIAAVVDGLPFHPDQERGTLARTVRWLTAKTIREAGVNMTGGSSSVRDVWEIARTAGATARAAFVEAAAARAGVPVSECTTARSVVTCGRGADARTFRYGELLTEASTRTPKQVTLKDPSAYTIIGRATPRLDARAKVTGAPLYGMDVRLDGMKYAAVAMAPVFGSTVMRYDRDAALQRPGVRAVVPLTGSRYGDAPGVAIIADSWWQAKQALPALAMQWSSSPHATLSSTGIMDTLRTAARGGDGLPFRSVGNAPEAIQNAATTVEAMYDAPYLAHATMEPMNCTVRVTATGADVWTGTQVPGWARAAAARVLDVSDEQVTLYQQLLGGGFGRRLEADYVAQATAIAKAMPGVPVQTIWSREDDMRHDMYRPAAATMLRAGLDNTGRVVGVTAHSASQAPFKALSRRVGFVYTSHIPDKTTAEGTWDQPYEFPAMRAAHAEVDFPVPVGSWRAVGHSHQAFFFESFIDELAHAAKQDPVQFRRSLLANHPRALAVLNAAVQASNWDTPPAPAPDGARVARGVSLHWSFATLVAQVVEVSVGAPNVVRVHRVVCAVDCGVVVNPAGVRQQVEGAVLDGLSTALLGEITVEQGAIREGNFHEYRPLRFPDAPTIEVVIVPSAEVPSGIGEPALPGIAPSVANALFALTGVRHRSLPLRAAALPAKANTPAFPWPERAP